MEERLNKLLSAMGVCSRREADRLIQSGKVLVDGVPAKMGQKVRMDQTVVCGGKVVGRGDAGQSAVRGKSAGQSAGRGNAAGQGAGRGNAAGQSAGRVNAAGQGAGRVNAAGQGAVRGNAAGQGAGRGNAEAQGAGRLALAAAGTKTRPGKDVPGGAFSQEAKASARLMKKPKPVLLAVNKPKGVVCTASDKDKAPNIVDMIQYPLRVYYVGRLDKDSEGLVLMTNQGDLVNKIMRSGNAHEKEYQVTIDRPVTAEFLARMEKGVKLKELNRTTLPCKLRKTGDKRFSIVLTQGLNRQIRRMCEACGCHVRSLKRVRVMNICLGDLKSGEYRQVEGAEYREFMKLLENSTNLSYRQQNAGQGRDQSDGE